MNDQSQTITPQEALAMYASKWVNPVAISILEHANEYLTDTTLCTILTMWAELRKRYEDSRTDIMRSMLDEDCTWIDSSNIADQLEFIKWDAKKANAYSEVLDHLIYEHNKDAE